MSATATTVRQDPGRDSVPELSHRQVLIVFAGLIAGMILAVVDQTIVATALPTIVGDLGGLQHLTWVITAYLLASTVTTPLWGKIGDLYGRKRVLQATIGIFLLGSALCGLATNMGELIGFRALQGVGAGGLMALAMAVVADIVSPRQRGRYQGYIQVAFTLASIAGPLLGGYFIDHLTWRWVFYVNIPVGAIALLVISLVLRAPARVTRPQLDYLGAALLGAGVTSLLLVTIWGGTQLAWTSPQIAALSLAGVVLLTAFVLQERRAVEPILPPRLFRNPVFVVAAVALVVATFSLFAVIVFVPLFLQVVSGSSATSSGLLLLPVLVGATVSTVASGRVITRTGRYKIFPVIGLVLMTAGLFLLSRMGVETKPTMASLFMVTFGLGFGLVTQVLVLAIQNAVDRRDLGTATAAANFFRALGGSIGITIFGAIFANRLNYWSGQVATAGPRGRLSSSALLSSPAAIRNLPPAVHAGVMQAVAHSLDAVFLVAAAIAALGVLVVLLLKEEPLADRPAGPDRQDRSR